MNDQDLRDCFAMFALVALAGHIVDKRINPKEVWEVADAMLEARKETEEDGIVAIRKRVRKK
jgi:hypothetical protein